MNIKQQIEFLPESKLLHIIDADGVAVGTLLGSNSVKALAASHTRLMKAISCVIDDPDEAAAAIEEAEKL